MFTRFEEYAATQMLGQPDSPPRSEGKLLYREEWQRTVFGMALALSKEGHFEWENFRQQLISAIATWENEACGGDITWDYYEHYTIALIAILEQCGMLDPGELERQMTSEGASK
jgi:nitrile hydratase accessory protein